jgi:hypothetical protein
VYFYRSSYRIKKANVKARAVETNQRLPVLGKATAITGRREKRKKIVNIDKIIVCIDSKIPVHAHNKVVDKSEITS